MNYTVLAFLNISFMVFKSYLWIELKLNVLLLVISCFIIYKGNMNLHMLDGLSEVEVFLKDRCRAVFTPLQSKWFQWEDMNMSRCC